MCLKWIIKNSKVASKILLLFCDGDFSLNNSLNPPMFRNLKRTGGDVKMLKINNDNIQKNIRKSAYIGILNRLTKENKITNNEYEKIKSKICKTINN